MKSKAHIKGHPLHPALIGLPIGMLMGALLLDVLAVTLTVGTWLPAGALLTMVGIGLLAVAAIPGFVDYHSVVPKVGRVRRTATRHMTFGLALAGLYIASSLVHAFAWSGMDLAVLQVGLALNGIGALGLLIQGWMGSSLVYKWRVAVVEPTTHDERQETRRGTHHEERGKRRTPVRV